MRIGIITPVFEDWESFQHLANDIGRLFPDGQAQVSLFAVNDGSSTTLDLARVDLPTPCCIAEIQILHLALNLGHQRAIAVGLTEVSKRSDLDLVVIMDSDGEDRPIDIPALLAAQAVSPHQIIVAARAKRSERFAFKAGYWLYRLFFQLMSGHRITFGNFSVLPPPAVQRLVYMSELWNNLPGTIIRSRIKFHEIPIERGTRYAGKSKMNFTSLIAHGLSAMSVHTDTIFVRVLLVGSIIGAITVTGILAAVVIRLTTNLAIPGWTTSLVSALMIILMQAGLLIVSSALMVLASRSHRPVLPVLDSAMFISRRESRSFSQLQALGAGKEAPRGAQTR